MYPKMTSPISTQNVVRLITKKRRNTKDGRTISKKIREWRKQRKQVIINHLRSDFAVSSTHGLTYIVNQDIHWCERMFWAVIFTGHLIFAVYLLAVQLERFIETPIVMSVEMDYFNWNVSYPAFTLCPAIKPDTNKLGALINETYKRTGKNLEKYLWIIASANMDFVDAFDFNLPTDIVSLINPKEYVDIAASLFMKFDPSLMTTNTNWPISVEEVMTELGMCHTVNSNIAPFDNPSKWSNSSLVEYTKNNIELSVHDRDFFTQIMEYAEIYKVYIHSPDETILMTTSSYTLSLKGFMSFGVQIWESKISEQLRAASLRLRKCRLINEPFSERFPIYSYNRCMLECRIQMILKICGCIPHFYKPLPNERICRIDELKCIADNRREIVSLSATKKLLKINNNKGLPRNSHECGCVGLCDNVMFLKDDENFIPQPDFNRLRIGISSYPKVRVVREIIFSGYEVILKIGGAINLCVGSSILSMIELVVTFIKIPVYCLTHKIKNLVSF